MIPSRVSDAGPDVVGILECPGCGTTLKPGHASKRCSRVCCGETICKLCGVRCECGQWFCGLHVYRVVNREMCGACRSISEEMAEGPRRFYAGGLD